MATEGRGFSAPLIFFKIKNKNTMRDSINIGAHARHDDVFIPSEVVDMQQLTGLPVRKGLEKAILCGGQVVNVVSANYGHLPNEHFFPQIIDRMNRSGMAYTSTSTNRDNRSFAMDFVITDPHYFLKVSNGDLLKPMLRFVNSYDGSNKTSGHFGFFRQVCTNGLHVGHTVIGFSVRHTGGICEFVLPYLEGTVHKFIDTEYFEMKRKFEAMAATPIRDTKKFIQLTADEFGVFRYDKSDKNPEPSANAQFVEDVMRRDMRALGTSANLWIGYNAFNEILHGKLKRTFEAQRTLDTKMFEHFAEQAMS